MNSRVKEGETPREGKGQTWGVYRIAEIKRDFVGGCRPNGLVSQGDVKINLCTILNHNLERNTLKVKLTGLLEDK